MPIIPHLEGRGRKIWNSKSAVGYIVCSKSI